MRRRCQGSSSLLDPNIVARWHLVVVTPLLILAGQILVNETASFLGFSVTAQPDPFRTWSPALVVLMGIIFAPLVETLIFQWACIKCLQMLRLNAPVILVISGFLFALAHEFEERWPVDMFIAGLAFSWVFLVETRRPKGFPVLVTVSVHALFNAMALAISV